MGNNLRRSLGDDRIALTLQPGDILLWRVVPGVKTWDRLIGEAEHKILKQNPPEGMQYYHVAFVTANPNQYYSSQPPKIDKLPVPDPLPSNIEVYRLKQALNPLQLALVFQYAESRRGNWYPILGIMTAGWLQGNDEFCSQYTEDSFAHYPLLLCPNIRFSTPDDIAASPLIAPAA